MLAASSSVTTCTLAEERGARELGVALVRLEEAVRAGAARVHDALGDALAVEMGVLLEKLPILHQQRPARAGGQAVLVVADRDAGGGGQGRRRHAGGLAVLRHLGSPLANHDGENVRPPR